MYVNEVTAVKLKIPLMNRKFLNFDAMGPFIHHIFHSFENFVIFKNQLLKFTSSIDASDGSVTADIICRRKSFLFQNPS